MSIKPALVTIEKDIEIAAETALHFVAKTNAEIPEVAGALGVVLSAVGKAIADVQSAAQSPTQVLNISFDQQVYTDLKAVWPQVQAFVATLGVKI
jgi:hypothetical protein